MGKDVDRSQSITHHTGHKLDFIIIGALPLVSQHSHDSLAQWRFRTRGQLNVLMVSDPEIDSKSKVRPDRFVCVSPQAIPVCWVRNLTIRS